MRKSGFRLLPGFFATAAETESSAANARKSTKADSREVLQLLFSWIIGSIFYPTRQQPQRLGLLKETSGICIEHQLPASTTCRSGTACAEINKVPVVGEHDPCPVRPHLTLSAKQSPLPHACRYRRFRGCHRSKGSAPCGCEVGVGQRFTRKGQYKSPRVPVDIASGQRPDYSSLECDEGHACTGWVGLPADGHSPADHPRRGVDSASFRGIGPPAILPQGLARRKGRARMPNPVSADTAQQWTSRNSSRA